MSKVKRGWDGLGAPEFATKFSTEWAKGKAEDSPSISLARGEAFGGSDHTGACRKRVSLPSEPRFGQKLQHPAKQPPKPPQQPAGWSSRVWVLGWGIYFPNFTRTSSATPCDVSLPIFRTQEKPEPLVKSFCLVLKHWLFQLDSHNVSFWFSSNPLGPRPECVYSVVTAGLLWLRSLEGESMNDKTTTSLLPP